MSAQGDFAKVSAITGMTVDDFRARASALGLTKARDILAWLRSEYGLNYHSGGAVYYMLAHNEDVGASDEQRLAALFGGPKARWRSAYDRLAHVISAFGADVELQPTLTCVNARRGRAKFAIIQPNSGRVMEVGLQLAGAVPDDRLEAVSAPTAMATHRVRLSAPEQVDEELLRWLRQAYVQAGAKHGSGRAPDDGDLPAGLAAPARRALAAAGVTRLSQLASMPESQISRLHGIGPAALTLIRGALAARGLSFAPGEVIADQGEDPQ